MLSLLKYLPKNIDGDIIPRAGREKTTRSAISAYLKEQNKKPELKLKKGLKSISVGFIFKSEKYNLDLSFETFMAQVREKTEPKVTQIIFEGDK